MSRLRWILPAAALMDAGENLLHLCFIQSPGTLPAVLYSVAGSFATSKWLLIAGFAVTAIYAKVSPRVSP